MEQESKVIEVTDDQFVQWVAAQSPDRPYTYTRSRWNDRVCCCPGVEYGKDHGLRDFWMAPDTHLFINKDGLPRVAADDPGDVILRFARDIGEYFINRESKGWRYMETFGDLQNELTPKWRRRAYRMAYGLTSYGEKLPEMPEGWELVPEGERPPQCHRECVEIYPDDRVWWCHLRRCHSTMTALEARVWGDVRAYARIKAEVGQEFTERPGPTLSASPPKTFKIIEIQKPKDSLEIVVMTGPTGETISLHWDQFASRFLPYYNNFRAERQYKERPNKQPRETL